MTFGFSFSSRDSGWPMPPHAPRTDTLYGFMADCEKHLLMATLDSILSCACVVCVVW